MERKTEKMYHYNHSHSVLFADNDILYSILDNVKLFVNCTDVLNLIS